MRVEKDYEELFKLFNKHKVRYCIIGAYAVAFYARPRYTKDIDILIEPSVDNSGRVVQALNEFGFESLALSAADFRKKGNIIQLGYEPVRIDILTSLKGCSFAGAWKYKETAKYGREKVYFIGLEDLIRLKKMSKRPQDSADLIFLLEAKNSRKS
ncbi:MAG: nucleotidyltransferase [Candidatus Aminicenantales bacterium]